MLEIAAFGSQTTHLLDLQLARRRLQGYCRHFSRQLQQQEATWLTESQSTESNTAQAEQAMASVEVEIARAQALVRVTFLWHC